MANALHTSFKQLLLGGDIALDADVLKVALIEHALATPDPATHDFLSDISAGVRATTAQLTTPSIAGGVFDADDTTFGAVAAGNQANSIVLYKETTGAGTPADDPLILFIDTASGLPVTPNGGTINIQWDSGAAKIFSL